MAAEKPRKRFFCVRIYPSKGPHAVVALLADSASDAETLARSRSGHPSAPTAVFEVADNETVLVTFPNTPDPARP
jgi:hypothetical protein